MSGSIKPFEILPEQDMAWCALMPPAELRQNLLDLIPGVIDAGEDGLPRKKA